MSKLVFVAEIVIVALCVAALVLAQAVQNATHGLSDPAVIIAFISLVIAPVVTQLFSIYNANRIERARKADALEAKEAATEVARKAAEQASEQKVAAEAVARQVTVAAEKVAETATEQAKASTAAAATTKQQLDELLKISEGTLFRVDGTLTEVKRELAKALDTIALSAERASLEHPGDANRQAAAVEARRLATHAEKDETRLHVKEVEAAARESKPPLLEPEP